MKKKKWWKKIKKMKTVSKKSPHIFANYHKLPWCPFFDPIIVTCCLRYFGFCYRYRIEVIKLCVTLCQTSCQLKSKRQNWQNATEISKSWQMKSRQKVFTPPYIVLQQTWLRSLTSKNKTSQRTTPRLARSQLRSHFINYGTDHQLKRCINSRLQRARLTSNPLYHQNL